MASSSNSSSEIYEVFLSFRGEDTRRGFTSHLYEALKDRGVHTFMDDERLELGEKIGDNLWKAIEGSSVCIPIFSPGYATSRWCLMEVSKMVECDNKTIIPVFYNVDPSDVRKQRGPFEAPFLEHEENFHDKNKVEKWRKSLAHVGELKGFHLQNDADGYESRFILLIVKEVLDRFDNVPLHLSEHLFGIDSPVKYIMKLLSIEDNDVRMIGMVGMGGIGKTTLSKVVYNKISKEYEASSFLSDVREGSKRASGLTSLQQTLLHDILKEDVKINVVDQGKTLIRRRFSHKKVLIVLDDVDHKDQLEALAGECNWFGRGSRIIITTRDEHVLNVHGLTTDLIYRLRDGLNDDDSLRLFCHHAFRKSGPEEEYMELSRRIVSTTGGLPLALEVFGSLLFDKRDLVEWEEQLKVLKGKTDIQEKLRISYDGLSEDEKTIFLDIACFFIGEDKNHAISLWKVCGLMANSVVKVLLQRSLIKIEKRQFTSPLWDRPIDVDVFRMHDLVRDMGRGIADHKNNTVRFAEKAFEYISRNPKRSMLVERIDMCVDSWSRIQRVPISLLRVSGTMNIKDAKFKHMTEGLRWLQWKGCGMKYLPNDFNLEKIVVLQLLNCYKVTRLWKKDWLFLSKKVFKDLKVLDLGGCDHLKATPDFPACPNLEWLDLDGCYSLVKVDESIGTLHSLCHLSLVSCLSLVKLPSSVWTLTRLEELRMAYCWSVEFCDAQGGRPIERGGGGASLEKMLRVLDISCCFKLTRLPDVVGCETEDLIRLDLHATAIEYLPDSIGNCTRLVELNVSGTPLKELPAFIGRLTNLTWLAISSTPLKEVPASIGNLTNLTRLDISCTALKEVPASIGNLTNLTRLDISNRRLTELPNSIGRLANLNEFGISNTALKELPDSIGNLMNLTGLDISCTPLKAVPASIGNLTNLTHLRMRNITALKELPDSIGNLTNLTYLDISGNETIKEIPDFIEHLQKLELLGVVGSHALKGFP